MSGSDHIGRFKAISPPVCGFIDQQYQANNLGPYNFSLQKDHPITLLPYKVFLLLNPGFESRRHVQSRTTPLASNLVRPSSPQGGARDSILFSNQHHNEFSFPALNGRSQIVLTLNSTT
jgi:hypothetical protein